MPSYSVAATKDNLSSLIDKALAGEQVVITRHGKAVVELKLVTSEDGSKPGAAEVYERLRKLRASLPMSKMSSIDLIREMRDEGIG